MSLADRIKGAYHLGQQQRKREEDVSGAVCITSMVLSIEVDFASALWRELYDMKVAEEGAIPKPSELLEACAYRLGYRRG